VSFIAFWTIRFGWIVAIALAVPSPSRATISQVVTFNFNAGDLLRGPSSVGQKADGNQKVIARDIYDLGANTASTFSSSTFNQYERWAKGLSSGEGMSSFNIFLRADMVNASSWGQKLKLSSVNSSSGIGATAGSGWNYKIVEMTQNNAGLTPGPAPYGYSIQWWTTNESSRIRFDTSLEGFSFSAPVELFDTATQTSSAVALGENYTVWFGTQNRPLDILNSAPDFYIQPLKFDNVWDGGVAGDTFAAADFSVWNGSLVLQAIPEPSTGSLLLVGAGLAWLRRRRFA
jgi:hypothetical protein